MLRTPFHTDDVFTFKQSFPHSPVKKEHHHHDEQFLDHFVVAVTGTTGTECNGKRRSSIAVEVYESELVNLANAVPLLTPNPNFFDDEKCIHQMLYIQRKTERSLLPSIRMFQNNQEILPTMRETLHLGVHYLDRFLSLNIGISKSSLQLIGIACLFIAAKLEEIYPPKLKEFSEVCDGNCTREAIHEVELQVLGDVQWRLNFPTALYCIGAYLELLKKYLTQEEIEHTRYFCMDFLDIAIHSHVFVIYPYSITAASLIFMRLRDESLLRKCCGYSFIDIAPCVEWLTTLYACPESIIFFEPDEIVVRDEFNAAIRQNCRVMDHIMEQILTSSQHQQHQNRNLNLNV